jgi:hypothetical protein
VRFRANYVPLGTRKRPIVATAYRGAMKRVKARTVILSALFAVVSGLLLWAAIVLPVGDPASGLRAWNTKVAVGIAAFLFLGLAVVVPVRARLLSKDPDVRE